MKNGILAALTVITFFACKKETKTPPVLATAPRQNNCTATINGVNWKVTEVLGSGHNGSNSYEFSAQTAPSIPFTSLNFLFPYSTGTYQLALYANVASAYYQDQSGTRYYAGSGTLNITALDSFYYGLKKMQATFSFTTDTIGGKSYSVTGGVIDYIRN